MSLRARLLAASLVLVVVGLAVADVATYRSLKSFLYERVDTQLQGAQQSVEGALFERGGREALNQLGAVVPGVYVQVRDADDQTLFTAYSTAQSAPKLPARVVPLAPQMQPIAFVTAQDHGPGGPGGPGGGSRVGAPGRFLTVRSAEAGGPSYRVRVSALAGGGALVIALPLRDTAATLHQLLLIELFVSLAVVAIAAGVGLWLVRLGLRPLADIEATAASISGGDLTPRVERDDDKTEVGRLGKALNLMLDKLDVAFAERRRFVADASHELRTPVAAVRAYAELYRRGGSEHPEDLARILASIENEAARMGVLVDDLLLLARLDEGRPLEEAPTDLGALAADSVAAARVLDPDRRIDLQVDGSVEVMGDQGRLRQVVDNLLANVRAHTPLDAPAEVRVRQADGRAVVEVADRGPGLSGHDATKVFDRFYRADPSRSRDGGGSGLGLSIVSAIAGAHGGTATAIPREGGGTVFRIDLPAISPNGDSPPTA